MSLIDELRELARQQADVDGDPSFHRGRMLTAEDTKYWQAAQQLEAMQALIERLHLAIAHALDDMREVDLSIGLATKDRLIEAEAAAQASLDRQGK